MTGVNSFTFLGIIALFLLIIFAITSISLLVNKRLKNRYQFTLNALSEAKKNAENANHAKSRYIIGMSHELRTPLNAILGYAQLLEQSDDINQKAVRIIRRSGEHLSSLIDGLLDISRIETGRMQLEQGDIDFIPFLDQIVDIFRLQAEEKGLNFVYEAPPFLPPIVRGDEKRLRQVLINLLSNAIKYTDKGEVKFTLTWRNGIARFSIFDSGQGIKEEDLQRIFEPFERIMGPTDTIQGLGLGLTITRLLTTMMGGDIKVESTYGKGSHFCVTLMLSSVAKSQCVDTKIYPKITGYKGKRQTILLVDDDEAQRSLIKDLLTPLGFNVLVAKNSHFALEVLENKPIDLFILDIEMPGLSGLELAQIIKCRQQSPIIMLSANINKIDEAPNDGQFFNAALAKPFQHHHLLEHINSLLPIDWIYGDDTSHTARPLCNKIKQDKTALEKTTLRQPTLSLDPNDISLLKELAAIGYHGGIIKHIDQLLAKNTHNHDIEQWLNALKQTIESYNLNAYNKLLEQIDHDR